MQKTKDIIRQTVCVIVSFLILSCWISSVFAQEIPHLIKYHGALPEEAGGPPGNPPGHGGTPPGKGGTPPGQENQPKIYTLTFRIYNTETGGLALWEETHPNVLVEKGEFEGVLGSISTLDLRFDEDYWLSIEIDNKGELGPRERITSVAYAYMAEDTWKLGGRYSEEYALTKHSHLGEDVVTAVAEAVNADMVDGKHASELLGGTTDHGQLLGLEDDDHLQYLNLFRGDERYAGTGWDGLTKLRTAQDHIADKNNPHVTTLEQLGHIDNNPEEEAPTATERGEPTGIEIQQWADDIISWGHTNLVGNLNADMVDGFHATASSNPQPNSLLALNAEGKFPSSVIPPISGLWTDAGTYIYPNNVGTGFQITDPGYLIVPGHIGIGMNDLSQVGLDTRALFIQHNNVLAQFQVDDTTVGIQSITNHPLRFGTNNITRVTIDTSGNVGIGKPNPENKLHIVGGLGLQNNDPPGSGENPGGTWNFRVNADGKLLLNANSPAPGGDPIMIMEDNSANVVMGIKDGNKGNVGIGIISPSERLQVNGYVKATGYKTGDIIFEKDGQSLWRMFEDEDGLYVKNLKTGRVYKIALQEVASE